MKKYSLQEKLSPKLNLIPCSIYFLMDAIQRHSTRCLPKLDREVNKGQAVEGVLKFHQYMWLANPKQNWAKASPFTAPQRNKCVADLVPWPLQVRRDFGKDQATPIAKVCCQRYSVFPLHFSPHKNCFQFRNQKPFPLLD